MLHILTGVEQIASLVVTDPRLRSDKHREMAGMNRLLNTVFGDALRDNGIEAYDPKFLTADVFVRMEECRLNLRPEIHTWR